MTFRKPPAAADEAFWREFLTRGDSKERAARRIFARIPSYPRCRMCAAPFAGVGAPVMRLIGKRQSDMNPNWCNSCSTFMRRHHGGAEVDGTMLFADVRGSTSLAEGMSTAEFHHLLDRFYSTATSVVFEHDGAVDKFVGDELVAMFFPLLSGERHAARAVEAAQALLRATGHADPAGAWVPLGVGAHTGKVWFGAVGEGTHVELTALGDAVNTTARLASVAGAGEILVTEETAAAAGLDPGLELTALELKGKRLATRVVKLRVSPGPAPDG
ncbi:MAG: adenylate/guanylate cyclase domain-containing protein [Candidatus Limnocylindrales bacterium]